MCLHLGIPAAFSLKAMRHFSLILIAPILATFLSASSSCTGSQSERCKRVCQQETECAAQRKDQEEKLPYDLEECVIACVTLERDSENRGLVEKHEECVNAAEGDCEKLMKCQ